MLVVSSLQVLVCRRLKPGLQEGLAQSGTDYGGSSVSSGRIVGRTFSIIALFNGAEKPILVSYLSPCVSLAGDTKEPNTQFSWRRLFNITYGSNRAITAGKSTAAGLEVLQLRNNSTFFAVISESEADFSRFRAQNREKYLSTPHLELSRTNIRSSAALRDTATASE